MSEQATKEKSESPEEAGAQAPDSSSITELGIQALQLAKNGTELVVLEVLLALQSIPKAIAVAIVAFTILVFAWLAFSAGVAYLAYMLVPHPLAAIAGFLLLQILMLGVCLLLLKHYSKRMTLPNTRHFAAQARSAINESFKSRQ